MSNENPTGNTREVFDENEAGIAQKKQEITDAVAAGDYGKVAELAQEAKAMETAGNEIKEDAHGEALEMNAGIDEAKAAKEKAGREAALLEQQRLDAEKSQQEAAALLEKMKGGGTVETGEDGKKELEEALKSAEAELKDRAEKWHSALGERDNLYVVERSKKLLDKKLPDSPEVVLLPAEYSAELMKLLSKGYELQDDVFEKQDEIRLLKSKIEKSV